VIIVAPGPFEEEFTDTAPLERALTGHTLRVVADPAAAPELLLDAEILVTGFEGQEHDALEYVRLMPRLRWIHSILAGLGSVASEEIAQRGVLVSNGAGAFAVPIAEFVLASLVMLARGLGELVLAGAQHRWAGEHRLGWELDGARAGIIGYGGIGTRVAELLAGAGMTVAAVTRSPERHDPGPARELLGPDGLPALLASSDAVVLCASLNPSTRGLIGERELAALKPGAVFVNVSRGQLVDERALVRALVDGRLAGAVIDVTANEPLPPESPLWDVPNLWITPHLAGGTYAGRARALACFVDNLPRFAAGATGEMVNLVDVRREIAPAPAR